ncbi:helix-turn-helix transcriptional regulator [Paenibacillus shunpengii]|uniref:Helix-turn-helix transcriptional regulator n=1 Tax=Paenibacillus shunpengii TaxID=2054424 RepID=A0ABW5SWX4_9BACL
MEQATKTQPRLLLQRCSSERGTQRKVANELGITEAHLRAILSGKHVPGTRLLFRMAHYFNKSVYELFPDLATPSYFIKDSN